MSDESRQRIREELLERLLAVLDRCEAERIGQLTDAEVEQELRESGLDPDQVATRMREALVHEVRVRGLDPDEVVSKIRQFLDGLKALGDTKERETP